MDYHGGKGTMWKNNIVKLQKSPIMNKNISADFAARFAAMSISSLVESFNAQVGNTGLIPPVQHTTLLSSTSLLPVA